MSSSSTGSVVSSKAITLISVYHLSMICLKLVPVLHVNDCTIFLYTTSILLNGTELLKVTLEITKLSWYAISSITFRKNDLPAPNSPSINFTTDLPSLTLSRIYSNSSISLSRPIHNSLAPSLGTLPFFNALIISSLSIYPQTHYNF